MDAPERCMHQARSRGFASGLSGHMPAQPRFANRGQGLVEYAFILLLVVIVVVLMVSLLAPPVQSSFSQIGSGLG